MGEEPQVGGARACREVAPRGGEDQQISLEPVAGLRPKQGLVETVAEAAAVRRWTQRQCESGHSGSAAAGRAQFI